MNTRRPQIIGIVNITEDSFSDGGVHLAPDAAVAHAKRMRADGADIVELGPASSHPDAAPVSPAEERRRIAPVIEELLSQAVPISVDSFLPDTQRFAISQGVGYLNDVHGFPRRELYEELAAADCRLIVMHSVQTEGPATYVKTDPEAIWSRIERFFHERLTALKRAGIAEERLIIDPGLGYFLGSNPEPSLTVMARLHRLQVHFGTAVLVSPSRKSFLRSVTGRGLPGIGPATLAAELYAAAQGVDYIRTHDVAALRDALTVQDAISSKRGRVPRGSLGEARRASA